MDAKIIAQLFRKNHSEKTIERIFLHEDTFIVEAYPKNEKKDERAYSSYYAFNKKDKNFITYNPMNTSVKKMDVFFESAAKPLSFD